MKNTIAVFGTFDTKGQEFALLKEMLGCCLADAVMIDTGLGKAYSCPADYVVREMLEAEGKTLSDPGNAALRADYLEQIARRTAKLLSSLQKEGKIQGAVSMGGGQGTYIAGVVMRSLPIGFPKVLLSVIAHIADSAQQFEHLNDTVVLNSLVDIAGVNQLLKKTMLEAAGAVAGMAEAMKHGSLAARKTVGISAWGVTTPCVNFLGSYLEKQGVEPYVFHANGEGGSVLETLIRQGEINVVADITLSELSIPLAGGALRETAGRLESACAGGVGQVVVPGGLDMVLARAEDLEPGGKFEGRTVYRHNPQVLFIRSNEEENLRFAEVIAKKLNRAKGPAVLLLPLKGLSAVDREGEIFYRPDIDEVLYRALKEKIMNPLVAVREVDAHINSEAFAQEVIKELDIFLNEGNDAKG